MPVSYPFDSYLYFVAYRNMVSIRYMHTYLLLLSIIIGLIHMSEGDSNEQEENTLHHIEKRQSCADSSHCLSQWGYCGTGNDYCGAGCQRGPCYGGNGGSGGNSGSGSIITDQNFACAFNTIDAGTRANRLSGLRGSGWNPVNRDEAAVFLAHVFHETDGLKVIREYCAPGQYKTFFEQP